ncbi:hypothetical protein [Moraxella oblonga]|uniref:hypothetical protein n=1 Tax=Moraxella oblonga TaxID=200413 RepID=UPI00082D4F8B|nr:hypothetical protein [Moraxella oblonga]
MDNAHNKPSPSTTSDVPDDVIPLFGQQTPPSRPSKAKIAYDIALLLLLAVDLVLILADNILMSGLANKLAEWMGFSHLLGQYAVHYHDDISAIGGVFTVFWVVELSWRWVRAIIKKTYFRWFFFPFVHWYETLACFPALRALRLLRAGITIKRLHDIGVVVIPKKWIKSAQFYYHVLLEELSDRVILTAIGNFRNQMEYSQTHQELLQNTIDKNRAKLEAVVLDLLKKELTPKLQSAFLAHTGTQLSKNVGLAVEQALLDTPELRKYLKLIPIAGSMIESQITHVGRHIGENITSAINAHLFDDKTLDALMTNVAHGIANIDTTHPQLQALVGDVVDDALTAFEAQVKTQQWKHKEQLHL